MRALALLLLLPSSAGATKYTLEQLLARVKSDYPGVNAARMNIDVADADLSAARRLWAPTGQLTFGFTLVPSIQCLSPVYDTTKNSTPDATVGPGGKPLLDAQGMPVTVHDQSNCVTTNINPSQISTQSLTLVNPAFKLDVSLLQPIYTFGKIEAAIKAAHAGQDAAQAQLAAAEADAVYNAVRAYWGIKAARAARATLDDGRNKVKEWVDKINDELEKGTGKYVEQDLMRLKIAVDTLGLSILQLQKAEQVALAALRTLSYDQSADVDDAELEVAETIQHPINYYEDAARVHRPEARLLDTAGTALHAQRKLRLAEMLPDLGLVGSFNWYYAENVDTPGNAFLNHPNSVGVGLALALRQPLDFALRLAAFDKARAQERAYEQQRKQALGGIALEIDKAYAEADEARKRQSLTAHGEKIARGWYNSVDQLLQVGTVESRDLVDAARNYFELRLQHLSAIMDLNVALAGLKRAAGVD
jgi:outer membrane protein TolC